MSIGKIRPRFTLTLSETESPRFPTINGLTVLADFNGRAPSTDSTSLILSGVDHQMQLPLQIVKAFDDQRHL